jgi:peptide/nickel transport system substrate-binding protein
MPRNTMNKRTNFAFFSLTGLALVSLFSFFGNSMAADVVDQPAEALDSFAAWEQAAAVESLEPQPHPILSDVRVRRAIAHCTDKDGLVAAAYPELTPAERQELISDTFIHSSSWAYSPPATTYPYSPTIGVSLLEDAGWMLPLDGDIRMKDGDELVLTVRTTSTALRLAGLTAFENQMRACGIRVVRDHEENLSWLGFRDFEAAEYAWIVDEADPGGAELYACDQVPSAATGWTGQNFAGWCNQAASDAIIQASDTSRPQQERQGYYAAFIDLFAEDIPVLPLFFRNGTTSVWEHIDFNLETYAQDGDLTPGGTGSNSLTYLDYQGNQLTVAAPTGAVTQTVTLRYYPLVFNSNPPPSTMLVTNAFRLDALLAGVPQDDFQFVEPITVTVGYTVTDIVYHFNENSLALFAWDEGADTWIDASETCPMADQYKRLDTTHNLFEVRICHLSEFGLFGKGGESIRMGVNYGLDEAAGMYDVGHSFSITVTNSSGIPKATVTVITEPGGAGTGTGPDFAWSDGFWVEQDDWSDPSLDILPGDWVHFQSDDGFSESVQVGTITARLFPSTDSAAGTITAPGFAEPLQAFAGSWGWFWQEFTVEPDGGAYFVDFAPHDLEPDTLVSVGYREPDLDQVINVFRTPPHEIYLPCTLKGNTP